MTYIPNVDDLTRPFDSDDASTAAAEFRAIKGRLAQLTGGAPGAGTASFGFRQAVVAAKRTAGDLSYITAVPSSLNINILGASSPLIVTAAGGFSSSGAVDRVGILNADTTLTLPLNTLNYVYCTVDNVGALTFGATSQAPKYQKSGAYDTTAGKTTFNTAEMVHYDNTGATLFRVYLAAVQTSVSSISSITMYETGNSVICTPVTLTTGTHSLVHNLGILPGLMEVYIENVTPELNYSTGDRIPTYNVQRSAAPEGALVISANINSLTIIDQGGAPATRRIPNKVSGTISTLTPGNWKLGATVNRGW